MKDYDSVKKILKKETPLSEYEKINQSILKYMKIF